MNNGARWIFTSLDVEPLWYGRACHLDIVIWSLTSMILDKFYLFYLSCFYVLRSAVLESWDARVNNIIVFWFVSGTASVQADNLADILFYNWLSVIPRIGCFNLLTFHPQSTIVFIDWLDG